MTALPRLHTETVPATRSHPAYLVVLEGKATGVDKQSRLTGAFVVKTIGPAGVCGPVHHFDTQTLAFDRALKVAARIKLTGQRV